MSRYYKFIWLFIIVFLFFTANLAAKNTDIPSPVKLGNNEVLYIKTGVGSFSAKERADSVSKKLEKIAKDPHIDINSITISESDYSTEIVVDDTIIITISQKDALIEKKSRIELAKEDLNFIKWAVKSYRETYSLKSLILGLVYTLLTTIGLILFIKLIDFIYLKLIPKIAAYERRKISPVYVKNLKLLAGSKIAFAINSVFRFLKSLIKIIAIYFYLVFVLSYFPWTFPIAGILINTALYIFNIAFGAITSYIPKLLFIVFVITANRYLFRFLDYFFDAVKKGIISFSWLHIDWTDTTKKLIKMFFLLIAIALIYPNLPGAGTEVFKGFSIVAGIIFSIGSSRLTSNIVSGTMLTYTRAFSKGERVRINDSYGDIIEKDLLVTRIKTIKNEIISIPNSKVLDYAIINYSKLSQEEGLILYTEVTIGYDAPREQVESLLIQAAKQTIDIIQDKEPFVLETSLGDYYITYQINAFTDKPNNIINIYSDLHKNILDVFNQADVEIMSPHYFALRDGNQVTVPEKYLPENYLQPSFNINLKKEF